MQQEQGARTQGVPTAGPAIAVPTRRASGAAATTPTSTPISVTPPTPTAPTPTAPTPTGPLASTSATRPARPRPLTVPTDPGTSTGPGTAPPAVTGPPQDPRAAARASLAAGRSPSLWWVCAGVVAVVVVTATVGAAPGTLLLAAVLGLGALARLVLRPGPVALTVRSRTLDTAMLAALAVGVGLLSQLFPTR